jgi:hypothetical protein
MIKIALNPFIFQIAEFTDLQINTDNPLNIIPLGVFQNNFQNFIRDRQFVHRFFSFSKENIYLTTKQMNYLFDSISFFDYKWYLESHFSRRQHARRMSGESSVSLLLTMFVVPIT